MSDIGTPWGFLVVFLQSLYMRQQPNKILYSMRKLPQHVEQKTVMRLGALVVAVFRVSGG